MARPAASPYEVRFLQSSPRTVTEIVLVRHGQQQFPPDPATASVGGFRDAPLSEVGLRQADLVGQALAGEPIDAVYSSHLSRARVTGGAIAAHHRGPLIIDREIREIDLYEGLTDKTPYAETATAEQVARARERFLAEARFDGYPHAEDDDRFRARAASVLQRVAASHRGRQVVVACHGGVINGMTGSLLGRPESMFFRPAHASITRLAVDGDRWTIRSLGETGHLRNGSSPLVTY